MKCILRAVAVMMIITGMFASVTSLAFAEEEVCVTIYPCDEMGNTIAPYDTAEGYCAEKFRLQCSSVKVAKELNKCESERASLEQDHRKLLRALRKKVRSKR